MQVPQRGASAANDAVGVLILTGIPNSVGGGGRACTLISAGAAVLAQKRVRHW
jgi:hypothetical protein